MKKIKETHLNATLCIKNKQGNVYYLSNPKAKDLKKIFQATSLNNAFFVKNNNPVENIIQIGKEIIAMDNSDNLFDLSTLTIVEISIVLTPFPKLNTLINIKN